MPDQSSADEIVRALPAFVRAVSRLPQRQQMEPTPSHGVLKQRIAAALGLMALLPLAQPRIANAQQVPGYPGVTAEYIEIDGAKALDTPSLFNKAHFLRLKPTDAPGDDRADAIVIAQPGFGHRPAAWLQLASQVITKSLVRSCPSNRDPGRGCVVEFWIVSRRGSQLEDTLGLRRALLTRDPSSAIDYYYGSDVYTSKGTVRRPADGNWDSLLRRRGSSFAPLRQGDLGFLWDWGFETAAGDIDALLDMLPSRSRAGNVFLAGHSQGGSFITDWAGRSQGRGRRGYQEIAGLIFLDGGPAVGAAGNAPSIRQLEEHLEAIESIRNGSGNTFGAKISGIPLGSGLAIRSALIGLYYMQEPRQEAIFPPSVIPAHPAARCFVLGYYLPSDECNGRGLRLTNRAHAGLAADDDPIPGAFVQTPVITALGHRLGHLDFEPSETAALCAAPGPLGPKPPCPLSQETIDPERVYRWLDGGGRGDAGEDGPLNGWTTLDGGRTWNDEHLNAAANPSSVEAYILQQGFTPTQTNVRPYDFTFEDSGKIEIDPRALSPMLWYPPRRYDLDLEFLEGYQQIVVNRDGVVFDIDKTAISVPLFVASRQVIDNPFDGVSDYTAIGPTGTVQTEAAKQLSPIAEQVNSSLYGHSDFIAADDSLAGQVQPGEVGASLVSNTLVDWLLARKTGSTETPSSRQLDVEDWGSRR